MTVTAKQLREATLRGEGPLAKAADDEPVFLLRGQDKHAADLVEKWAIWASVSVPASEGAAMYKKIAEAALISEEMRRWPIQKDPD
ncbi:hypothetical protein ABIF78_007779 [Bradyrhizobium japonicum]|jgi:hypothetical protein